MLSQDHLDSFDIFYIHSMEGWLFVYRLNGGNLKFMKSWNLWAGDTQHFRLEMSLHS